MKKPVYSEDFALLYGILLGDGCLSRFARAHCICITCSIYDDIPFFEKVVIPTIYGVCNKKCNFSRRKDQGTVELKLYNKELFKKIEEIGFPVGHKGTGLKISESFEKSYYKYIIQGYFATDGSLVIANNNGTKYPRIEFASISKILLHQVLYYLISLGMKGNLYLKPKDRTQKGFGINDVYRLQFNGKENLRIFVDKIGLVNPKYVERYDKWRKMVRVGRFELPTTTL